MVYGSRYREHFWTGIGSFSLNYIGIGLVTLEHPGTTYQYRSTSTIDLYTIQVHAEPGGNPDTFSEASHGTLTPQPSAVGYPVTAYPVAVLVEGAARA